MCVHLIKLAAGAQNLDDLRRRNARRIAAVKAARVRPSAEHLTRMFPRRKNELLGGGSLYWVVKGLVLARQEILDLRPRLCEDGVTRCVIVLAPDLVETEPQPRRAFQGWRYLPAEHAPGDVSSGVSGTAALYAELAQLGLL